MLSLPAFSAKEAVVYRALRAHEGAWYTDPQGQTWARVFLADARPTDMLPHSFSGVLSGLTRKGVFRMEADAIEGDVRVAP